RLQSIQRSVATDGDQSVNSEFLQTRRDQVEFVFSLRIDVVARRSDECAALGRIEFRNSLKEGIQMDVGNTRVEETIETLDKAVEFNLQFIRAYHSAMNRGVQRGRVPAGGQNADTPQVY